DIHRSGVDPIRERLRQIDRLLSMQVHLPVAADKCLARRHVDLLKAEGCGCGREYSGPGPPGGRGDEVKPLTSLTGDADVASSPHPASSRSRASAPSESRRRHKSLSYRRM